ncbi:MAG: sigma-54-dependent Fis family transcriptional regulator [Bacteriovoracaceae bacterium]|nr:sigma-54-dependent Fis family transcriptional regulator [Bacteriovoracaceae bacterium]
MLEIVNKLKDIRSSILLTGETGTGKSRLARLLHEKSSFSHRPLVIVDCASLNKTLIESELFGHTKGAYTGAVESRVGRCEIVREGTLVLDEIGELNLDLQKKLLYLLEERKFCPLGSNTERKFNGRIIAATNKDLKKMVVDGTFRKDLYYRLLVFYHKLPSLSEDQQLLQDTISTIFNNFKNSRKRSDLYLSSRCKKFLCSQSWPGNIRQIKNCLEYVFQFTKHPKVEIEDLPSWLLDEADSVEALTLQQVESKGILIIPNLPLDYRDALGTFENKYFNHVLNHFGGKINCTAEKLRISKSTLLSKVKKYSINTWQIKANANMALLDLS